ncbi:ribbon-helix-helix domain-containing protein [Azospirillum sp. TSO35-2]|uniref:ribbon-helix-helix domain-containing protein n=1 Tax=Azospirillum sp. TSO35-2 TaxID=716796 RepID=UPI000D60CA31|nr:ribbon-helix-helix domain-containing protein [Azospirillum sp. TSO35-2]PWC32315.1 arylsulfate sulfotransferase [Azospirillum sp. TSO35-2]
MCEIYVKADPILYEPRSRSVRIHGVVTTIRLESLFWDVLAEIAARDGMTTNQLIAKLYDEIVEYRGEVPNLASFLRVSCLRYLSLVVNAAETRASPSPSPRRLGDNVVSLRAGL